MTDAALLSFLRQETDGSRYQTMNRLSLVDGFGFEYSYRYALAVLLGEQGYSVFPVHP
jgi:hypothetical protein